MRFGSVGAVEDVGKAVAEAIPKPPGTWEPDPGPGAADERLLRRVFDRCHIYLSEAGRLTSIPVEFLAALTANESGGNAGATRFEPSVYRHLKAVAQGHSLAYGSVRHEDLGKALDAILHPKTGEFHALYLTEVFGVNHAEQIQALADEAVRELATSWGLVQIMGYHVIGRPGTPRDLLDPATSYRTALELLAEFAHLYQLNVTHEFQELFRCWNTGRPYGATFDPRYAENGIRRMDLYRELAAEWTRELRQGAQPAGAQAPSPGRTR